jgi:hypothetical protein
VNVPRSSSDQLVRTFTRSYDEEAALALSAMDCILNGEKAVYASSELTTGRRTQAVRREIGATKTEGLRQRLGEEVYAARIWNPNVHEAMAFARRLHHSLGGNQIVVTPAPFSAPGWNQKEYLRFWKLLLTTRIKAVYFNVDWEYSDGCTFEFVVAVEAALPIYDAASNALSAAAAIERIESAIVDLERDGLDTATLVKNVNDLKNLVRR